MKKLIIALTCAAVLFGCKSNTKEPHTEKMTIQEYNSSGYRFMYVVEMDGCEYVVTKNGYSGGVCHKR